MRYPRMVKTPSKLRPAAGYCKLHRREMSCRQINYKGCVDPYKQRQHGNEGDCQHLRRFNRHPMWGEQRNLKGVR